MNTTTGSTNTAAPTPSTTEEQAIERHQLAHNALAVASWHVARGDIGAALSRIRRATAHLKQGAAA